MTISAPMTITWRGDALLANFRFSAHSSYRRPRAPSRAQGYAQRGRHLGTKWAAVLLGLAVRSLVG